MRKHTSAVLALAFLPALACGPAAAQTAPFGGLYTPRVPVSAFARPSLGIDPTQFHVSTSFSVGSGFGGGSSALQVTSLSYQFRAPVWMQVSVGNDFGSGGSQSSAFFLEGLNLAWQPSSSMMFQVRYQNVRSPLQFGQESYPYWRP